jgi:YegS/Rv2252/BmrU family lipid kinase
MKKFIFLVNPISGTVKKQGVVELIHAEAAARSLIYEIVNTRADGNYTDIKQKIITEGITHVCIVGGDGTVNTVVNGLKEVPVKFAIVPMGSGNGLALTAGIPRLPALALQLAIDGKAKAIDAFMVNEEFSCMLSGLGFDAQVAHDFSNKASRGLMTYTRQTLVNYFTSGTYPFEVAVDKFTFSTDAFFISIANSNQFGNRVTIAPQASLSDGLLDIVIVQKMNKALLPFAILSQLRGANKTQVVAAEALKKNIVYFQTSALKIRNWKKAPLHIDGEPKKTADVFDIRVIRNCFKLVQPLS